MEQFESPDDLFEFLNDSVQLLDKPYGSSEDESATIVGAFQGYVTALLTLFI